MFFRKRPQQDKPNSSSPSSPEPTKRTVTDSRWNRLYFGFPDPSVPSKTHKKKKRKNLILTPKDVELIDYCHRVLIEKKEEEIQSLTKLHKSVTRDCQQKDQEMRILKQKYVLLQRQNNVLLQQMTGDEYCGREWEIEKKHLLQELREARRASDKQRVSEDYFSDTESESLLEDNEEIRHFRNGGLQGTRLSMRMSVQDLIQDIEDDIEEHKQCS